MNFDNILGLHVAHGDEIVLRSWAHSALACMYYFAKKNGYRFLDRERVRAS